MLGSHFVQAFGARAGNPFERLFRARNKQPVTFMLSENRVWSQAHAVEAITEVFCFAEEFESAEETIQIGDREGCDRNRNTRVAEGNKRPDGTGAIQSARVAVDGLGDDSALGTRTDQPHQVRDVGKESVQRSDRNGDDFVPLFR